MTSILIPGSPVCAAFLIMDGVAGEVDGIIKIRQGDVKEGIVEIGFSALKIYGGVQQGSTLYNV